MKKLIILLLLIIITGCGKNENIYSNTKKIILDGTYQIISYKQIVEDSYSAYSGINEKYVKLDNDNIYLYEMISKTDYKMEKYKYKIKDNKIIVYNKNNSIYRTYTYAIENRLINIYLTLSYEENKEKNNMSYINISSEQLKDKVGELYE